MRLAFGVAGLVAAALIAFLYIAPAQIDRGLNRVVPGATDADDPSGPPPEHGRWFVADLHADPLLWNRDLLAKADHGHVDIPRLAAGGVALQVFAVPTQIPSTLNYESNELRWDLVTPLAVAQGWPARTWRSPLERALYLAQRLHDAATASQGRFSIIESVADLDAFAARRGGDPQLVAGLLAIEGMQAIEGDLGNLALLYQAGYRMMGLTHFFDNDLAGSAHGLVKGGLTELGRQAIRGMEASHIVVDLAHASPTAVDDVLAMATKPVVVSHTGVKGTCDHVRNLSDDHLRGIARNGGVVGIGYWDAAICDVSVAGVVGAIAYTARLVGVDHVGLGSDFDGATTTPFDSAGIPKVTDGLRAAGFSEVDIEKVMGGNVRRVLTQVLPPQSPATP